MTDRERSRSARMAARRRVASPPRMNKGPDQRVSHFRPHPWHGLEVGPDPPEVLNAYIEITPFDLMKYEVDKVDHSAPRLSPRPCTGSSRAPTVTNAFGDWRRRPNAVMATPWTSVSSANARFPETR